MRHPRYMDSVKTAEVAQTDIKYSNAGKCIVSRRRAYYPPRSRSLVSLWGREHSLQITTLAQYRACWPGTEPTLCERRVLVTSLLLCGLMSFNCGRYLPSDRHGARSNLFKNKWRINIFHGHSIRLEYGDLIARFCTAVGDPLIPTRADGEREAPRGSATRTCAQYLFNNLPHK